MMSPTTSPPSQNLEETQIQQEMVTNPPSPNLEETQIQQVPYLQSR